MEIFAASVVQPETLAAHRRAVERVILMMRRRLSEELSLDTMADTACMSLYHFNRIFRQLTGIPPVQFLGALRLEAAKGLLLTTEASVTDVCFEVGYNSLGTFTTRFTQLVGLSPGQFRRLGQAFTPASVEALLARGDPPPPAGGAVLGGRIRGHPATSALIFMGLFEKPIPQRRPVACAVLAGPGAFRIHLPANGPFFLFAAGLARPRKPLDFLVNSRSIRGLASAGPFAGGQRVDHLRVSLRPPDLLDPPLLVTLPLLIDERLARRFADEQSESFAAQRAESLAPVEMVSAW